ncbi:MAG: hypothetical protein KGJ64_02875 [Betaproteobacteria bacterium]|nr:hypothetical protein [Betaproteobacteria bacterium]
MSPTPRISARRALLLAASACLSLGLAACGGGAAAVALIGGGVGTGGTGMVLGTVVGLGSVIVDGQSYSSATPNYFRASGTSGETASNSQAVGVGARVDLQLASNQQPSSVLIQPDLEGAPRLDASSTLTVNGVRVLTNSDPTRGPVTFYSGLGSPAAVASASRIDVHGAYGEDASGPYIQASLIEQLPASDTTTRITGVISALSAQSLTVAGQSIPLGPNTSVVAGPGVNLAPGQLVHVWRNGPDWVVRVQALGSFTGPVQMGGLVYGLTATGFTLSGIPVDTSSMSGAVPALQAGDYVVVSGHGDGQGTLVAQSIQAAPTTVTIRGTITGYVSASSFQVRGMPIDASQASFTAGSSAGQLGNGAYVVIQGAVSTTSPNVISAAQVSVLSAPQAGETVDLQGTVTGVTDASHFALQWQTEQENTPVSSNIAQVSIAANCAYVNGGAANIAPNTAVEVEGTYQNGTLSAYTIKFLPASESSSTQEISGRVYGWTSGGSSFELNGITLGVPQGMTLPSGFDNGVSVEVSFTPSGSGNTGTVQKISIDN